jgi:hypothetical protein
MHDISNYFIFLASFDQGEKIQLFCVSHNCRHGNKTELLANSISSGQWEKRDHLSVIYEK